MTRKEEIEKIASTFAIDEVKDTCNPASKRGLLYAGFVSGAEWADQHPMTYDGKAMLYVNSRSHENGYNEAVDKACKWLDENFRVSSFDNTKIITHFSSMFDVLDSFRKAMKGD